MNIKQSLKVVNYHASLIVVPDWTKFIAMNKDGSVYAWENKPIKNSYLWYCYRLCRCQFVAHGNTGAISWEKSLVRYYATGAKMNVASHEDGRKALIS